MAEPAIRTMTLDEFLRWDDGTDTRYELVAGFPMAMAPPAEAHRILAVRLVSRLDAALAMRRPCNAQIEAGVLRPDRADTYFVADIGVTCTPNKRGRQAIEEPVLLVEILSPSTERHDRQVKLPAYRQIDSVEEILLIDSQSVYAEILRREGDRWISELVQGPTVSLRLSSVELSVPMAELYDGIAIEPDPGS
ncbi:MAG TPA: Uma2 family endonuclease [Stellaceae bacterium]|jgi:Uma2 family endonuclease